jgi:hypothetical protein
VPKGRPTTVRSPTGALHPNAAAGPSTSIASPQATPASLSPVLVGNSPRVSPTRGTITVDQELFDQLLENHKLEIIGYIEDQEDRMQQTISNELQDNWSNLESMFKRAVADGISTALPKMMEDLQKHLDKKIDTGLNAHMDTIQGSMTRGIEASLKEEMSKSLHDKLQRNNDELALKLAEKQKEEDSGLQKIQRVLSLKVNNVGLRVKSQKVFTAQVFNKVQNISRRHQRVGEAIESVLRPLRTKIDEMHKELPRLDLIRIDTTHILDHIKDLHPTLQLRGEAQVVEVCLFRNFM